jgi:hypothetical protein
MGWASGSEIMSEIIDEARSAIPKVKARRAFYHTCSNNMTATHWTTAGVKTRFSTKHWMTCDDP